MKISELIKELQKVDWDKDVLIEVWNWEMFCNDVMHIIDIQDKGSLYIYAE